MEHEKFKQIIVEVANEDNLNLEDFDQHPAKLTLQNHQLTLEPIKTEKPIIKSWWYIVPTILASILFAVLNANDTLIPLTGDNSLASYVITSGIIVGIILFVTFFILGKKGKINTITGDIYWRNFPSVLISYLIILTISILFVFELLQRFFLGVTFDLFTATFIFMMLLGVINYLMIYAAIFTTPESLIRTLMIIAVGGVGIAMLTNSEQQWWLVNLSYLGSNFALDNWRFNLTLVLAGLLMIALIDFLFETIYVARPKTKQLTILKTLLVILAICLALVGVFPYNENPVSQILHNVFARGLVVVVLLLIMTSPWMLPNTTKDFMTTSYGIGSLLVIVTILFLGVGYLSLTAFEILAFILAFSWLLLFLQKLVQLSNYGSRSFTVDITIKTHEKE